LLECFESTCDLGPAVERKLIKLQCSRRMSWADDASMARRDNAVDEVDKPTTVILCRHGESEGNLAKRFGGHGPTPLTARGREQALTTGRALAGETIDAIYCSDLARAIETAALIAQGHGGGLTASTTEALRERSVGSLTGLTFDEAREKFPAAYEALMQRDAAACPPGGETITACRERAVAFFEQALGRHPGARILLVSHYATLHQLISHIIGVAPWPHARAIFQVDNCALHRFEQLEGDVFRVLGLNNRGHL
jgi:broad specificity phosphatase PhoE